jgi:hypothetical protein
MYTYFFNDLSLSDWIDNSIKLDTSVTELLYFIDIMKMYKQVFYLHTIGIHSRQACGMNFRSAVNKHIPVEKNADYLL